MASAADNTAKLYGGRRPSELPAYSIGDAARCLNLPTSTVRSWVLGRRYETAQGVTQAKPVIHVADRRAGHLSFVNLVEVHVLAAIRRHHRVRLPEIRKAVTYLERKLGTRHPLTEVQMMTDGTSLFVEKYGELINVSQEGQLAMKRVLELYLDRVERDPDDVPIRLFPFTKDDDDGRLIFIDPRVQFGRPCIAGTRVPALEVAERFRAGESTIEIADDFELTGEQVEAAIRYELRAAA